MEGLGKIQFGSVPNEEAEKVDQFVRGVGEDEDMNDEDSDPFKL